MKGNIVERKAKMANDTHHMDMAFVKQELECFLRAVLHTKYEYYLFWTREIPCCAKDRRELTELETKVLEIYNDVLRQLLERRKKYPTYSDEGYLKGICTEYVRKQVRDAIAVLEQMDENHKQMQKLIAISKESLEASRSLQRTVDHFGKVMRNGCEEQISMINENTAKIKGLGRMAAKANSGPGLWDSLCAGASAWFLYDLFSGSKKKKS